MRASEASTRSAPLAPPAAMPDVRWVFGGLFGVQRRHPRPGEPRVVVQTAPARWLTDLDTAKDHHASGAVSMCPSDVAGCRLAHLDICRNGSGFGRAESEHADERKRDEEPFHAMRLPSKVTGDKRYLRRNRFADGERPPCGHRQLKGG